MAQPYQQYQMPQQMPQQYQQHQMPQQMPQQYQQYQMPQQYTGAPMQQAPYSDVEGPPIQGKALEIGQAPPEIRNGFIRKVYSILSVQLAVTFAIAFYMNTQLTPAWVAKNMGIYYACMFGTLALTLGVSCCCAEQMRSFPQNYCFLAALTLGMATLTGFVTVLYTSQSVLMALATTVGIFLLLTAYACLTKTDFTGMGPYLAAGLMAMCMFGFVMMFWSMFTGAPLVGSMVHKIYAGCGVLLFTLYIVYDTQLIVGGQHKKHQFSVDDYVFAALNLYLDIINLFLYLLSLMGDRR